MLLRILFATVLWVLLDVGLSAQAADIPRVEAQAEPACGHSIESAPKTVQDTLSPAYADGAKVSLKTVATRMNELMLEIGHCQALAQDHDNDNPNKQHDIAEWMSLYQWLYRLTSFVDQNARGDHYMDWKREFETFVDVYELKR